MIIIQKSKTADTRSCDFSQVTKEQLRESSIQHINDVRLGMNFIKEQIDISSALHDHDKLSGLDWFHADFITGFKQTGWYDNHRKVNRHHLLAEDGVPDNVNLVDVLDMIVDCVMAGMGRTGTVYPLEIKPEVLMTAFQNTVELLKSQIVVEMENEICKVCGMAGGEMMWISVKDRLPEKSGKYTVKTVEGSISPHEHERVLFGKLYPDGFMFHEGDWQHVTHWLEVKK